MKILREICGTTIAIELTENERLETYKELEKEWDMNYIKEQIKCDGDFDEMSDEELHAVAFDMADEMRDLINLSDFSLYEAFSLARDKYLEA